MTAALVAPRRAPGSLYGLGWCVPCYEAGQQVPAVDPVAGSACRAHVRLLPPRPVLPNQLALVDAFPVPQSLRAPHATGEQLPCSPCAAAGRDEFGLRYRFAGDPTPLCLSCWRQQEKQARREQARAAARERFDSWVEELAAEEPLAAADGGLVDEPAVREVEGELVAGGEGCAACGAEEPSLACWLCGYTFLAQARMRFELDQAHAAAEQAALQAMKAAAVEAEFNRIAARAEAAAEVTWLTGWVERCQRILAAYVDGHRWGRAVELLANALARDAAARTTLRGRPSVFPVVAAVLAVDSDFRTGRRSMPGREQAAMLAGCSVRATTNALVRGEAVKAWRRTQKGRRLSFAERVELKRWNDRAAFDFAPLHRCDPTLWTPYVPAAVELIRGLVDRAMGLLEDAQRHLDTLDSFAGTRPDPAELVRRARLRQAVARAQEATSPLVSDALHTGNTCSAHSVSRGECVSSCCIRGLRFSFAKIVHAVGCGCQPLRGGRRKSKGGASRSSTTEVRTPHGDLDGDGRGSRGQKSPRLSRPRTAYGKCSATHRRAPEWASWAYDLARDLAEHYPWVPITHQLPAVAAILGAALSGDWTAQALISWIGQVRGGRPLLQDPARPLAYLKRLLDQAMTGPVTPPLPARRAIETSRALSLREQDELRERQAATRAAAERVADAAVPGRNNAAVRELWRSWGRTVPDVAPDPARGTDEWPAVAQPGAGLPQPRTAAGGGR